jgi:putative ABC transport system substrate-binding protein
VGPRGVARGLLVAALLVATSSGAQAAAKVPRIAYLSAATVPPAMYEQRDFVEAGGLISYGPHLPDLFRRAATYVDKILKGARPGELPIEQPTRFELVVNLRAARALGLTIPQAVLLQADESLP